MRAWSKAAFLEAAPRYMMSPGFLRPEQSGVIGRCVHSCDLDGDAPQACVGASSQAECDCQTACYRNANPTPEQEAQIHQLAAGLDGAISAACR